MYKEVNSKIPSFYEVIIAFIRIVAIFLLAFIITTFLWLYYFSSEDIGYLIIIFITIVYSGFYITDTRELKQCLREFKRQEKQMNEEAREEQEYLQKQKEASRKQMDILLRKSDVISAVQNKETTPEQRDLILLYLQSEEEISLEELNKE